MTSSNNRRKNDFEAFAFSPTVKQTQRMKVQSRFSEEQEIRFSNASILPKTTTSLHHTIYVINSL